MKYQMLRNYEKKTHKERAPESVPQRIAYKYVDAATNSKNKQQT